MTVRPAKFADLPRMAELLGMLHARSRYAAISIDDATVRSLLMNAVNRHGKHHDGCTWTMVDEVDGVVEAMMIGLLDRVYHICDALALKDMYLFATDKAAPGAVSALIDSYVQFGESNPDVHEINLSWTDAVEGAGRIESLYERKGFARCGAIYVREKL